MRYLGQISYLDGGSLRAKATHYKYLRQDPGSPVKAERSGESAGGQIVPIFGCS